MSIPLITGTLFSGCILGPEIQPSPILIPYKMVNYPLQWIERDTKSNPSWAPIRCHSRCLEERKCASAMFSSHNGTCWFYLTMPQDTRGVTVTPENNITTLDKYCSSDVGKQLLQLGKKQNIIPSLTIQARDFQPGVRVRPEVLEELSEGAKASVPYPSFFLSVSLLQVT